MYILIAIIGIVIAVIGFIFFVVAIEFEEGLIVLGGLVGLVFGIFICWFPGSINVEPTKTTHVVLHQDYYEKMKFNDVATAEYDENEYPSWHPKGLSVKIENLKISMHGNLIIYEN